MPRPPTALCERHSSDAVGRREFIRRALAIAGSFEFAAVATMVKPASALQAGVPSPFDTSLESIAVAYRSGSTMTMGYLSRPRAEGTYPGVIAIHDSNGSTDHIRGVARRIAVSGYMVIAPDYLSRLGGTASFRGVDADVARATGRLKPDDIVADSGGTIAYMKLTRKLKENKIGVVGFGWGGDSALVAAQRHPEVSACVMFHGSVRQDANLLARLNAPLMAIFAGEDASAMEGIPAFEEALKKNKRQYEIKIYPGVQAGFQDETVKGRYNAEAAKDAWTKTIQHFDKYLKGSSRIARVATAVAG